MTRLRNLLERIAHGGGGPALGFGAGGASAGRLPGMALIARCSGDVGAALRAAGDAADAVVIFAPNLAPDALADALAGSPGDGSGGRIWGAGGIPLRPEVVAGWREAGADFAVSPLAGALVDAVDIANPGMTHGARIPDDADDAVWRMLAGVPLDFLVLDKSGLAGRWTLSDVGQVADAARRTDKRLVVRVGTAPTGNELLALRQAGAVAIVAEANELGAEGLAALKSELLELPRLSPPPARRAVAFESS